MSREAGGKLWEAGEISRRRSKRSREATERYPGPGRQECGTWEKERFPGRQHINSGRQHRDSGMQHGYPGSWNREIQEGKRNISGETGVRFRVEGARSREAA